MTDSEKKMKRYVNAVERKLRLPRDVRVRVMNDFSSSIQSRRDAGQTDEEIFAELGTPAQAAANLNEQMKEFAYQKTPWRWACLVLAVVCALVLLIRGGVLAAVGMAALLYGDVGIIGGADGPTEIFVARAPESLAQSMVLPAILLVMGLAGFFFLSRLRKK